MDQIPASEPILVAVTVAVTTALIMLVFLFRIFNETRKNLPPGPRGWGTTLTTLKATKNDSMHELATVWARKYGPITCLNLLGRRVAILNSASMTRRIFASDDFKNLVADRTPNTPSKLAWYNGKDLMFTPYDALARKKRKIFHVVMELYSDRSERFEKFVHDEMAKLLVQLEDSEDHDIELWKHLARSLTVIIYVLATGKCPDDVRKLDILEEYNLAFNKLWAPDVDFVLTYLPFLAKIPGRYKTAVDRLKVAQSGAEELLYFSLKKTWVPGKPRGVADHLFDLQGKPGHEWAEDREHVISFLTSIILAAHLSSRATVMGIFLCLLNYPEAAEKIHQEIDDVLGDRQPTLEDKASMPYTEAAIFETLRLISQIPLGGLRILSKDINIEGMTIPQGTLIIMNGWFFHHDQQVWEDPWSFKPERFLNNSGQLLPPDHPVRKNLLPFGIGVRACPGEVFSRSRVFMFVTSILQKFDVLPPESEPLVPADFRANDEEVKGFARQVRPFKCRLRRRRHVES